MALPDNLSGLTTIPCSTQGCSGFTFAHEPPYCLDCHLHKEHVQAAYEAVKEVFGYYQRQERPPASLMIAALLSTRRLLDDCQRRMAPKELEE